MSKKVYLYGFSRWKHQFIKPFLTKFDEIHFINPILLSYYRTSLLKALDKNSSIYIWGKKKFKTIEAYAIKNDMPITRVEDGFIRSIDLGSNLSRPYSQIFDDIGIYFDATSASRLENILNETVFDEMVISEAIELRKQIIKSKISKYNTDEHRSIDLPHDKIKILVPGQVESDASIKFGGNSMTNLELLKTVRLANKDAHIVYKPHPDVLKGNRAGSVATNNALAHCDEIISKTSMSSILQAIDEVHTITSLTGFEGLLYGKRVHTYGMPFYAGWGLTTDALVEDRRQKTLSLEQLIAGAYIHYPQYIHPETLKVCKPGELIEYLIQNRHKLVSNIGPLRFVYRKTARIVQKIIRPGF